ncbi:hypothetical protein APR50_41035 [Variovorax paradoxus]|jgi:hypothetical protein|uniref:hypothetical protein n=1 Tax=Variovorax paradoxus TaxID=34073 RepID=UPI0006E5F37B|nr:hypothetical protein APR50_41035 [Variovorax paradoxus]KPU93283.1 hypothetical protein APR52_25000 [Variovorax paradoxus]KPV10233.1 hypothetical protein APR49_11195 [Variovorax paradoxus]KPV13939.1 hypothetical protein APR51_40520 [Variovorax paradoxus]KPV19165.1 hypothetical protein APR48_40220 [Variovorax paradoxus]
MTEFNNRIAAQRDILFAVNGAGWGEELYGLSRGALDRWVQSNQLDRSSRLVSLLLEVAGKLFFLANKSQEQVTSEYRLRSSEVSVLTEEIRRELKQQA